MKWFAPKNKWLFRREIRSHEQPPEYIMADGFAPPTTSNIGSPIVAQWFNWMFCNLSVLAPFVVPRTGNADWVFRNPFSVTTNNAGPVVKWVRVTPVGPGGGNSPILAWSTGQSPAQVSTSNSALSVTQDNMTLKGGGFGSNQTAVLVECFSEAP